MITSRPMRASRRRLALATLLAVAWTALWPLVTSAKLLAAGENMPLCHQAGMQVSPDQAPMQPADNGERKQHCPLCIMAFFVAFTPPAEVAAPAPIRAGTADPTYCAPKPFGVDTVHPAGQAPPSR